MLRFLPLLLALAACGKGDDADGDGFYSDQDCDDADPGAFPGAPEACDGVDNDCDGETDESPEDGPQWWADADGDGFGNPEYGTRACTQPLGYVENPDDCDDLDARTYPGAEEWCDGIDNSCDQEIDDSPIDPTAFYVDADGDGYGAEGSVPVGACEAPSGYVDNDDDCDDSDAAVSPEDYWYGDSDGDGHGNVLLYVQSCTRPTGYAPDGDDCDDGDASAYPGAPELCDGADNDCDGAIDDEDDGVVDQTTWYNDADADGWGDDSSAVVSCDGPSGAVDLGGDCDDGSDAVYPGAFDDCDGLDNDCDGVIDSGCPLEISTADHQVQGSTTSDYLGYDLAGGGDYNGDGQPDLVVGAYGNDLGGSGAGAAYVFFGPLSGTLTDTDADVVVTGASSSDYMGYSLARALDLNGDGVDDLAVGAYGNDEGAAAAGAAYVWYGPLSAGTFAASTADAALYGDRSSDYFAQYFVGGGEVSGDGVADLVVGAYGEDSGGSSAGALYVFEGPVSGALAASDAETVFIGQTSNDFVGYPAVVGVDLNGDGVGDVAWGASGTSAGTGSQEAYVFYGPTTAGTFSGADADVTIGRYAASDATGSNLEAGDIDGDGNPDLIIGAKYDDTGGSSAGAVHGLLGPFSSSLSLATDGDFLIYEVSSTEYLGAQYNGMAAADIDGDGADDLALGSYSSSVNASSGGAVYFFYGPVSGSVPVSAADRFVQGVSSSEYVGNQVDFADVTGDGQLELLVGARGWQTSRGRVGVWDSSRF